VGRLLVVDDSPYYRLRFSKMFLGSSLNVVGLADDGDVAIKEITRLEPDVVTLDLLMPRLDGFSVLRWAMQNHPLPIVVCSSFGDRDRILKALELGAVDFVLKPAPNTTGKLLIDEERIIARVEEAAHAKLTRWPPNTAERTAARLLAEQQAHQANIELICIAASTGGPAAIQHILRSLPGTMATPIVITQHMPAGFTGPFAARLNGLCHYQVVEAVEAQPIRERHVYVAPAGFDTRVVRAGGRLMVSIDSPAAGAVQTPSSDALLGSVAECCRELALAVILSGMGDDGTRGARMVRAAGGHVVAESSESALIFGMPRSVIEAGQADAVLALWDVPAVVAAYSSKKRIDNVEVV
jgi:two-component system chemotaxis response regulator CheB